MPSPKGGVFLTTPSSEERRAGSTTSKRRLVNKNSIRELVESRGHMKAGSLPLNDDSTVTSASSLFSDSTGRSMHSLMSHESVDREVGIRICTGASHQTQPTKHKRKRVGFATVQIRKYAVTLGDNAEASYPLALDWGHTKTKIMPIDDFDVVRTVCPARLTVDERIARLRKMGYANAELRAMERDRKMSLLKEWENAPFNELEDHTFPPPPTVWSGRSNNSSKF
ncbi:hypothetical protein MHU86_21445 [Fragilaria crotonensis]|nr:hypothetical protein MHU86_21445 [Fragilaria crotonensis]